MTPPEGIVHAFRARVRAGAKSSVRDRLIDAVSLVLVLAIGLAGARLAPKLEGDMAVIGAVGVLLLAGTLTSKLLAVFRLPHLTGYLLAGILAGPHVVHVIDHDTVGKLRPVNTLALALIALAGGTEIRFEAIKKTWRRLCVAMTLQSITVFTIVVGVFVLASHALIPFTRPFTLPGVIAISILWGVIAVSRSPAATLAVLSETRARGPLASFSLAFVMTSDVLVVLLLACATAVARPLLEPSSTLSFAAFRTLGHEMLGSVAVGTTLGLVLTAYLRLVGKQLLLVLVALGFGATETLHFLRFEPLLTFLVAGLVVQNVSNQGEKLLHAVEGTGAVVYVVFFASAGAHLQLPLLRDLWPVALLLAGARAAATYGAARLSSRITNDPPILRTWGWAPLVSQAGLTLGLSAAIERTFPAFGAGFRALAIATVAINELVGPVLFKLSLDRAGEISAASVRSRTPQAEEENLATSPERAS